MGYRSRTCGRTAAEERYIQATLDVFAQLPPERKEAVRAVIARTARTPEEGMALFRILVQHKTLSATAAATNIPVRRLSQLRKAFFALMPL